MDARINDWVNRELYPFESKFISLESGEMHYIDEGDGPVILFVHGTPTWSFLYRKIIGELSKKYRCIAIDHMGFGLSDKLLNFEGRPQDHSINLTEFIKKLGLNKITLVVHDFGGPIGLSAAIRDADKFNRLILFNTWLWATSGNPEALKVDRIVNSFVGKLLYLNLNFSPKVLLKRAYYHKKLLTKTVHQQYIKPFSNKNSRRSLWNLAKSLVGSSDWYQHQWEQLDALMQKKWLIVWGTKDEFISTEYLDKWKDRIPQAMTTELACGHFVQEEMNAEVIRSISTFLRADHNN
tara:strand:- start:141 stop:1022 length:882 start_codon:yes stop_codon:yes gene_type:complete